MESFKILMNVRRLRHIKRCNNFPVINKTDVAQHSYFTSMLAMLFVDEFNENKRFISVDRLSDYKIKTDVLLRKCLLHDFEEAFTSDIPYPIKHATPEIQLNLEIGINFAMKNIMRHNSLIESWNKYRCTCKDGVEGSIVAFCDMLELAIYCYEEICIGNKSLEVMLDNCNKYLDSLLNQVIMNLYVKDLYYFVESELIYQLIPSIWKLRQLVQRNTETGEYILQDFTVDIS